MVFLSGIYISGMQAMWQRCNVEKLGVRLGSTVFYASNRGFGDIPQGIRPFSFVLAYRVPVSRSALLFGRCWDRLAFCSTALRRQEWWNFKVPLQHLSVSNFTAHWRFVLVSTRCPAKRVGPSDSGELSNKNFAVTARMTTSDFSIFHRQRVGS